MKRLIAIVGVVMVASVPVRADNMTYKFTAELNVASTGATPLGGSIAEVLLDNNINTLTGTFTYDPDAAQFAPGSAFTRPYDTGALAFDQFSDTPTFVYPLTVANDAGGFLDYLLLTQIYTDEIVDFQLYDTTGAVYSGLSLPTSIDLSDFDDPTIEFSYFEGEGESSVLIIVAEYDITSLTPIPEPASAAMLVLSGIAMMARRRRANHNPSPRS